MSLLNVSSETLNKLLRLAEQAHRPPEEFLETLLDAAAKSSIPPQKPQLPPNGVLHQWVLENISDTVFITRDDGTFTYVCPNIHKIFEYRDDEVWALENVKALGLGNLYQLEELNASGELANIETQIVDKAGVTHNLLINIKRVSIADGTVLYVCRDNTARKHMEIHLASLYEELNNYAAELESRVAQRTAELQQKSEQVEAILNHSDDAIALVNSDGIIQDANLTFYRYFGQNGDKTAPLHNFTRLFDHEQAALLTGALAKISQDGQSRRLDFLALRHDGIPFDADVLMSPVYNADQQVISIICSLRDITELKHIETELRRALHQEQELNVVRSRFVSTLSHEFRTPMAVILNSCDFLLNYAETMSDERKHQHHERIREQTLHMNAVLDELVTLGTAEATPLNLRLEPVDIRAFCQNVAAEVQGALTTHNLEFAAPTDCGTVMLDKKLMRQVIYNLLSNASKYSSAGSTIHFDVECEPAGIRLRVKDRGIGIPADELEQLFNVFYRATNVGTIQGAGLGLPIIKRAVEAHGGTVSVESQINAGTTVTVSLPREKSNLSK